jgi:hypothetical protein
MAMPMGILTSNLSVSRPMTTPIAPEMPIASDMAPDAAARVQPNSAMRGLRKTPKQSWVPKEPTSKTSEAKTTTQP